MWVLPKVMEAILKANRVTCAWLAKALDIDEEYLRRVFDGQIPADTETARDIIQAFGADAMRSAIDWRKVTNAR